jgi:ankyrin repeat protein
MAVRKTILFAVAATALLLLMSGCRDSARKDVGSQQKGDMICVTRADLGLLLAAGSGDVAAMQARIAAGADVNTTVEGLGTPLVAAALSGNLKAVQLLLDKAANVNAKDSQGYTALMNASLNDNKEMVKLLLAKGADVNAVATPTVNGQKASFTALLIARGKGYEDIVQLLTQAGAKQ